MDTNSGGDPEYDAAEGEHQGRKQRLGIVADNDCRRMKLATIRVWRRANGKCGEIRRKFVRFRSREEHDY
jgi:hypothetical protein